MSNPDVDEQEEAAPAAFPDDIKPRGKMTGKGKEKEKEKVVEGTRWSLCRSSPY
jgi:hypothetical protein